MKPEIPTSANSRFNEEGDWIVQQFFSPEELQPHLHLPHPHVPHPHAPDVQFPNVAPPRPARDEG